MIGAFLGAKVAVKWGPKFVRYLLLATIVIASAKMFGFF
jgi:uncharacterized membrane protein YfcA